MHRPAYVAPTTLEEASAILGENPTGTRLIAGGTDLIVQMRAGVVQPDMLVDLRLLPLNAISVEKDLVRLGSRVTHTQIVESKVMWERFPALAAACEAVGGPATRNRGTIGGNLANASPAADSAPPLLVYDTSVVVASAVSKRTVPLADFLVDYRQTALQPSEIIKEIRMPVPSGEMASSFIKLGKRQALTIAVVSVAARLTVDESYKVQEARIALGSVAPTPIRASSAEKMMVGEALSVEVIAEAANEAVHGASPISDARASAEYRTKMISVLVRRALIACMEQLTETSVDDGN
jgi:carbon-monoxide dehydrogenase medium subunit